MITRASSRAEDGAAAVEFAVIMPILLLLFFGIIYFGLTIYRQQVVESATREAARVMSVGGTATEVTTAFQNAAVGFQSGELSITGYERDGAAATVGAAESPCDGDSRTATVTTLAQGSRLNFTIPFFSGGTYVAQFDAEATFQCEV